MNIENWILDARSIITLLSFLAFIGIVLWAYSGRRSADFEAASNLPFADEKDTQVSEKQNG